MQNNTNDKGDTGVAEIIANLNKFNIKVAIPLSNHLPFDLIAISPEGKLARLSVKYKTKNKIGTFDVPLRTVSYNSQGVNIKFLDKNSIEAFAIYCPDNNKCYYVSVKSLLDIKTAFFLRIDEQKINSKNINFAKDYEDPSVIWR